MIKLTQNNEVQGVIHKCGLCNGTGYIESFEFDEEGKQLPNKKCHACNGNGYTVTDK